jgi:hypothetical protein
LEGFYFLNFLSFSSIFSKTEKVIHGGDGVVCGGKNMCTLYRWCAGGTCTTNVVVRRRPAVT